MISLQMRGVVVRNTIGPQYRKAHVLCKQGLWSGYIPSSQTTQLDVLTYATFLWTGNSINHTGSWSEITNPLHLNCFHTASYITNTSSLPITRTNTLDNTTSASAISTNNPHSNSKYSINTLCYFTSVYISQLAFSIPEKYPQNNIWTAMLRSIIHLQQQQWLLAWLTFEMSVLDEDFNRFNYFSPIRTENNSNPTDKTLKQLITQNYTKIASYTNKSSLHTRYKLSQSF